MEPNSLRTDLNPQSSNAEETKASVDAIAAKIKNAEKSGTEAYPSGRSLLALSRLGRFTVASQNPPVETDSTEK